MGHSKIETTQIYLRRLDQERAMERVKDLSWGTRFGAIAVEAPSGFEPLLPETGGDHRSSTEPAADAADELPEALRRIVQRVSARAREGADA